VAQMLEKVGALIINDPRVSFHDNNAFLDELERYFEQDDEIKLADARPELHYQVGVTPEGTEIPRCASDPSCHLLIAQVFSFLSAPLTSLTEGDEDATRT